VRQGTTDFSATLTPSKSATNLLSDLERKLADQEAKRRQLEERLRATQGLLEATGEKLGEVWRDKYDAVRRLEAKAFDDLAAQRRAADQIRDEQRRGMQEDLDRRERELKEEQEERDKRWEAEWRDADAQFADEKQLISERHSHPRIARPIC